MFKSIETLVTERLIFGNKIFFFWSLLKYALIISIANFIARIWLPVGESFSNLQFGYFPVYISFFIVGIIGCRNKWFDNFNDSVGVQWLKLSVLSIIIFPIIWYWAAQLKIQLRFWEESTGGRLHTLPGKHLQVLA